MLSVLQTTKRPNIGMPRLFARKTKRVHAAIKGRDVDLSICQRYSAPVIPGLDLISAVPQLFARRSIQSVEHSIGRTLDTNLSSVGAETKFRSCLGGVFSV